VKRLLRSISSRFVRASMEALPADIQSKSSWRGAHG